MDQQSIIKSVIDDINSTECRLETAIGDNPVRSDLRCALCHSASYACEYCESKAVYLTEEGKKKGKLTWPFSTANGPKRTISKIIEITDEIKASKNILNKDVCKGFWGTSHLLRQPHFHFIKCIPAEYMHSGCIGVVKRLVILTFNTGETRDRILKRKLSDVSEFNKLINLIQDPREFSRRLRNLDCGVMKAQEYRNLILFYVFLIIKCIPNNFPEEKKVWLQMTYVLRSCTVPNKEFDSISKESIEATSKSFYKNFESIYGSNNCSYSIHVMCGHPLEIRGNVPMTEKSAFKYENFYSELKNLFQAGTISPSKQIIQNCFMKRQLDSHICKKKIFYDVPKKGRENNSLIYYVRENQYQFFKIIKIIDDNNFLCYPQGRHLYKSDLLPNLKWENIGVFKAGPFLEKEVIIKRKDIEGKVIRVDDFLVTCANNILQEQ